MRSAAGVPSDRRRLGVALIGAGWVAKEYLTTFHHDSRTAITGVQSRTTQRAEQLLADHGVPGRSYRSLDELLSDDAVDIVVSCTPPDVRAEHVCAAAAAGKHVVVEKPVALTLADVTAIRDAVAAAGVRSVTSFVLRWHPQVQQIRTLLDQGLVGDLLYGEAGYWHPMAHTARADDWRFTTPGLTAFVSGGCHAVDMLRYLAGEIVEVSAFAVSDSVAGDRSLPFPPVVTANLRFASGAVGSVSALVAGATPYVFSTRLVGSVGTVQDGRIHSSAAGDAGFRVLDTPRPDSGDVSHHPFKAQVSHFLDCVDSGEESHAAVSDTWRSMATCYAIDQSAAAGGLPIRVPLPSP